MLLLVYSIYIGALYIALQNKNNFIININDDNVYGDYIHIDDHYDHDDLDEYEDLIPNYKHLEKNIEIYQDKLYEKVLRNPTLAIPCKKCRDANIIPKSYSKELDIYRVFITITPNTKNVFMDKQVIDCPCSINYDEHSNKTSEKVTLDNSYYILVIISSFILGASCSKIFGLCLEKYNVYIKESIDKRLQIMENNAIKLLNDGCHEEASILLQSAIDIIVKHKGKLHIDFGTFSHLLAKAKLNLGLYKSAEIIIIDVIKMYEPYGEDVHMREALEDLGLALQYQGRIDESVLIFSKVNDIIESTNRTDNYLKSVESNIEDIHIKYALPYNSNASDINSQLSSIDKIGKDLNISRINYYSSTNIDSTIDLKNNILVEQNSNDLNVTNADLYNTPSIHDLTSMDRVNSKKYLSTNISPETIMYEFENN